MFDRHNLAALATVTAISLGLCPQPADAALKTVYEQARDMAFSDDMMREIERFFPADFAKGVGRVAVVEAGDSKHATVQTTRTVRIVKTRQIAAAVTDDDELAATAAHGARTMPAGGIGLTGHGRGATLFMEESRELEERMARDIAAVVEAKGYELQAINTRMENLTTVKVVLLASVPTLTEYAARGRLSEIVDLINVDVLAAKYPNVAMSKASSFTIASAEGDRLSEASAMLYEVERTGFRPTFRTKTLRVPEPPPQVSHTVTTTTIRRPASTTTVRATETTRTGAVSLSDKEKAERAQEAGPAKVPSAADFEEKEREDTFRMTESDFQD